MIFSFLRRRNENGAPLLPSSRSNNVAARNSFLDDAFGTASSFAALFLSSITTDSSKRSLSFHITNNEQTMDTLKTLVKDVGPV